MSNPASASARPADRSHPSTRSGAARCERAGSHRLLAGGTDGNERLTVLTGVMLVLLTAAIGVTIIRIGQLMWLHLFLGLVLFGPVALKLASTGYRFVRYYTRNPAYRRKGPPIPFLRALAPLVVLATVALFATGVALLFMGRSTSLPLGLLHKVSFIAWIALVALHVLGHLPELLRALPRGPGARRPLVPMAAGVDTPRRPRAGGAGRALAMAVALGGGLVLAIALIGQFSLWTH
jgi:hypothetical protein